MRYILKEDEDHISWIPLIYEIRNNGIELKAV